MCVFNTSSLGISHPSWLGFVPRVEEHSNNLSVYMLTTFARTPLEIVFPLFSAVCIPWPTFAMHSKSLLHLDFCCSHQGSLRFIVHVPILQVPDVIYKAVAPVQCLQQEGTVCRQAPSVQVVYCRQGSGSPTISTVNQGPSPAHCPSQTSLTAVGPL